MRGKEKEPNSKVYMERTFISGGQWHFDTDRKNQSVIFGMVFYLYLQRPGVCDRAVVWESSIFVCGAESLCCDFLMIGTGIHAAFESRKAGRKAIWQWLAGLFLGGCIMLFVFVINCGINYHRESFRKIRAQNTDVFGERLASNLSMADRRGQSSEYTGREN